MSKQNNNNVDLARGDTQKGNESHYKQGPLEKRLIVPNAFKRNQFTQEPPVEYASNLVKSSRFNAWNFFPIAIAIQLTKLPNVFWLFNAFLQLVPSIRTNSPLALFIPIAVIVGVGMLKEWLADRKRKKQDRILNAIPVKKARLGGNVQADDKTRPMGVNFEIIRTDELQVGDMILVDDNGYIPADCVLVKSALDTGEAFIMTGQLDGERNFKPKMAIKEIQENFNSVFNKDNVDGGFAIDCNSPEKDLYSFNAKMQTKGLGKEDNDQKFNLDLKQFLPRGTYVKNSGQILALVLYTGVDTKILLNSGRYVYKKSFTDKVVNQICIIQIVLMLVIAGGMTIGNIVFNTQNRDEIEYALDGAVSNGGLAGLVFFTYWLILIRFIPLDLLVNLELSKIIIAFFIERDIQMIRIDEEINEAVGCRVQSIQLTDEIGQVDYCFCDKTGTLTKNELEFRAVSVKGRIYEGDEVSIVEKLGLDHQDINYQNFFKCIGLNHDVITVTAPSGKRVYSGSSQDELVLLNLAEKTKFQSFKQKDTSMMYLQEDGQAIEYKPLKFFDFTSDRKMMSMIVKDMTNNKVTLYVKGADTSVFPRCENNMSAEDKQSMEHVDMLAKKGLRTLCFAMKELTGDEDFENMEAGEAETDLHFLGATAVEDLLQNEVGKCISDFKKANIKVWMLTGDKGETANQIGLSTGLLDEKVKSVWLTEELLKKRAVTMASKNVTQMENDKEEIELLIDGSIMAKIINQEHTRMLALPMLLRAKGVIIYRASPSQKAQLVSFIRSNCKGKTTLAIGDGANDVNMIQSAHIGVGIMGKEGNQASSFADFAIGEFRDLRRLMFWHGRDFAYRYSEYVTFIIAKTAMTSLVRILWNFYTGYSGNQFVLDTMFAMYSVNVTMWGYWNLFESKVSFSHACPGQEEQLKFSMSELYDHTRENEVKKTLYKFWQQMASITYGSIVIFYFNFFGMANITGADGMDYDYFTTGGQVYITYVLYCHSLFYMNTNNYNVIMCICMVITFLQVWLVVFGSQGMPMQPYQRPKFIIVVLGSLITAHLPNIIRLHYRALVKYPKFNIK